MYRKFYTESPFVRVRDSLPELKHVRGTNFCDITVRWDERTETMVAISAIDNLVKGGAGQAIQNMNILFGLPETTGLKSAAVTP